MCDGITVKTRGLNVPLSGQHVLLIYSSKLEIKESFFFPSAYSALFPIIRHP